MAYLKDIYRPKCGDCPKYATVELCNARNAVNGYYCSAHAKRHLARLRKLEGDTRE